ncbi:MAG: competence/damage-inducible protein A [Candidatus Bathyarchaeota archaeon]
MIKAEILAVGDELLYGRVYDTNSFWIADQITRLGVIVQRITCVRDDPDDICSILSDVLSRSPSFVFITGGLGPTDDDKTLEALAKFTGRKVVVDENVLKLIAERRNMSPSQFQPRHYKMSSTIEGAKCLSSPIGWAPLTILEIGQTIIFTMPGPPKEVQSCFTTYIPEEIQKVTQNHSLPKRLVIAMRELELAPLVSQISKTIPEVYIKPLVSEYVPERGMAVEVIVFGNSEESCLRKYGEVLKMFKELVEQKGKKISED